MQNTVQITAANSHDLSFKMDKPNACIHEGQSKYMCIGQVCYEGHEDSFFGLESTADDTANTVLNIFLSRANGFEDCLLDNTQICFK